MIHLTKAEQDTMIRVLLNQVHALISNYKGKGIATNAFSIPRLGVILLYSEDHNIHAHVQAYLKKSWGTDPIFEATDSKEDPPPSQPN